MVKRMINTQRLVDIRELYGFSKEKLASKLNVDRKEVVKLEKGVIDPNFIIIRKLTELFSVSPDYFFNVNNIPHVAQKENSMTATIINAFPNYQSKQELDQIKEMLIKSM